MVANDSAPSLPRALRDGLALDMAEYRPWILQRGRSRPAIMLHLRRYEPKSGLWTGWQRWQMSYPHLAAVEYVGDRMLSLDFGQRQFVIEGTGLGELARHLQSGSVLMVQEYSQTIWSMRGHDPLMSIITKLGQSKSQYRSK